MTEAELDAIDAALTESDVYSMDENLDAVWRALMTQKPHEFIDLARDGFKWRTLHGLLHKIGPEDYEWVKGNDDE